MSRLRVPIAFAIAAVLGVASMRIAQRQDVSTATATAPLVPADAVDAERIDEIVLERDGVLHRFVRNGQGWQQLEPVAHAIDGWSMRQLIGKALKAESVRSIDLSGLAADARSKSLAEAGLTPPAGRIELIESADASGQRRKIVLELGRRSLAGRAYARAGAADASYAVIDGALHEFALGRDPREFRRRELFVDLGDVDRLAFRAGESELVLAKAGRDYRIDSPVRARADRVQVGELIDAVRRAKSAGFVSDRPVELSAYGLGPAMASLEIASAGLTRTLLIGDAVSLGAQDRFGLIDGTSTVVRIPAEVLATIVPRLDRIVDAVATGVRARDVGGIEIASGMRRISLRREADGWTATVGEQGGGESQSGKVERERVEGLLKALSETRAQAIELAAFPATESIAMVTLLGFAGEPLDTVRIARRESDSKWILENGDGVLRLHGAIELPLAADELGFTPKR
ncbi:MAG: hypothetical protein RLZZ116_1110 [Planctomycetota bacterium]|jgi:hypothetical protein